jgi:hypothetical protein
VRQTKEREGWKEKVRGRDSKVRGKGIVGDSYLCKATAKKREMIPNER